MSGISDEVDKILAEGDMKDKEYHIELMLDFSSYMLVYTRMIRSIIHT